MTLDLLQDAIVSLVALGAVGLIARRVIGFVRPQQGPACGNCQSAKKTAGTSTKAAPLIVYTRSRS